MDIGEQIRTLRSEVRAPFRSKQGEPHRVFQQATQDKVRAGDDGLADPDGFACRCASACSFIWASGFRRDGDVIGLHMFIFVDDAAARWSSRELHRQTARSVRELDGFLAKMRMPAPIRAHLWSTPPDIAALGDPTLVAKQWAAELRLTPEEELQQFLAYLEDILAKAQAPSAGTI